MYLAISFLVHHGKTTTRRKKGGGGPEITSGKLKPHMLRYIEKVLWGCWFFCLFVYKLTHIPELHTSATITELLLELLFPPHLTLTYMPSSADFTFHASFPLLSRSFHLFEKIQKCCCSFKVTAFWRCNFVPGEEDLAGRWCVYHMQYSRCAFARNQRISKYFQCSCPLHSKFRPSWETQGHRDEAENVSFITNRSCFGGCGLDSQPPLAS